MVKGCGCGGVETARTGDMVRTMETCLMRREQQRIEEAGQGSGRRRALSTSYHVVLSLCPVLVPY